jgi:hypothetical protein
MTTQPAPTRILARLRRRWPTIAGVALAALVALDLAAGAELAPILAASGLVYLGAAALGRPAAAWPVFLATFVVITVHNVVGGPAPAWTFLILAVPVAVYGIVRGAARPAVGLPLQALAMAVLGAAAVVVTVIGGVAGGYIVAAGLLAHAAWDVWHHRTGRVVVRSMAEFCFVLDALLAVAILIVVTV